LPPDSHIPARQTADYFRHGTITIFAALDMLTGNVKEKTNREHKSKDFIAFLKKSGRERAKGKVPRIF
jgi:small basic protein